MNISSFDSSLSIVKRLDGSKSLKKQSIINRDILFDILDLSNMFLGSQKWLRYKLQSMDSRRVDFFDKAIKNNQKQRRPKHDDRMSREIASFIYNGEKIII